MDTGPLGSLPSPDVLYVSHFSRTISELSNREISIEEIPGNIYGTWERSWMYKVVIFPSSFESKFTNWLRSYNYALCMSGTRGHKLQAEHSVN